MKLDICLVCENNKIKFKVNLPLEFMDINEDEYFNSETNSIYECNADNFNLEILNLNLKQVSERINKTFCLNSHNENSINFNKQLIVPYFNKDDIKIYNFIKNNKDLNIKIVIDDYNEIISNLKNDDYPNLIISFKNSYDPIPYKDFYLMFKKLDEVNLFIRHYNLSPLEIVMLVYDIVKANEYKKENSTEGYGSSRNLNEIIRSGNIVCVGFSNLVNFFLNNLGIKCDNIIVGYSDKEVKHERNIVYLQDDKYNINKILFLDSTWDSKKDDKYIDNYKYFLRPLCFFKYINNNEKLENHFIYDILYNQNQTEIIEYIKEKLKKERLRTGVYLNNIFSKVNNSSPKNLLTTESLTDTDIQDIVNKLIPIGFKGISKESFKNALYKVRRIEYLNKIIPFEPNEEYIDSVCNKFYRKTAEEKLLAKIFGETKESLDKALNDANATSVKEDLLRIRLMKEVK